MDNRNTTGVKSQLYNKKHMYLQKYLTGTSNKANKINIILKTHNANSNGKYIHVDEKQTKHFKTSMNKVKGLQYASNTRVHKIIFLVSFSMKHNNPLHIYLMY